ncbi:deoxynucleoside monophosphate kinase [Pseudomonas phage PspYZU05]|uniref:Deoxynucleoside monophosphate kinase n=1 Tax=Pseudomonas phage PspYZU05 TaxID=1983556 RepID=A0A2U7NLU6_9CAUD|nr:deoxynucleoside monophosphate kinase [Pseudomonas phage PspYZU05]ASD52058.1 deoxynucleoside monophosphate kinase [Pseudomonas phage PspYZU05]
MIQIIALNGKKRSGKDYMADHLVKEHGFTKMSFASHLKEALIVGLERNIPESYFGVGYVDVLSGEGYDRDQPINLPTKIVYSVLLDALEYLDISLSSVAMIDSTIELRSTNTKILNFVDDTIYINQKPVLEWSIRVLMQQFGTDLVQTYCGKKYWAYQCMQDISSFSTEFNLKKFVIQDLRFDHEVEVLQDKNAAMVFIDTINPTTDSHISEKDLFIPGVINIFNDRTEKFKTEIDKLIKDLK